MADPLKLAMQFNKDNIRLRRNWLVSLAFWGNILGEQEVDFNTIRMCGWEGKLTHKGVESITD